MDKEQTIRDRLWEIQSMYMKDRWDGLFWFGLYLIAIGGVFIYPFEFVKTALAFIPLGLGLLLWFGIIYNMIGASYLIERFGWADFSLEWRLYVLKNPKKFSKEVVELMKRDKRPTEEELSNPKIYS